MIFFGVVGPVVGYFADMHSFDPVRHWGAAPTAFLEAIVFVGCGLLVIWWSSRPPSNSDDDYLPPDPNRGNF